MGHATVRATLDAVHRVTVLCHIAMLCPCCATVSYRAMLILCCVHCAVLRVYVCLCVMPEAVVGNAPTPADPSQNGGALPMLTNPGDQTKIQVILHVESPTKPYRILCSRCETHWCIWFGGGALTIPYQSTDLAVPPFCSAITNHYRPRS